MLNLETRQEILGITVFQDYDEPKQFYYLPGSPHITYEKGSPLFELYNYRKGGEAGNTAAGGFLNMAVDLSIGDLKNRIEQRLRDQYGDDVTLASVPVVKGESRVIALGEDSKALQGGAENETAPSGQPLVSKGPRFIQNILGAGTPSLDGDNRSIFSFSLSEDGAAFFSGLFNGSADARPVGVVYELEYIGLLPSYDLEITIDFKSVYEYSRSRFTLGTLFFKADMDNIVEDLKRKEAIKIKDISRTLELSTPEAIQARQERIDRLVKDLATGALFQPSLVPGEPKVKGDTITAEDPTRTVSTGSSSAGQALRSGGPSAAVVAGMAEALNPNARSRQGGNQAAGNAGNAGNAGGNPGNNPQGNSAGNAAGSINSGNRPTTAADIWNKLGRPQAAFVLKNIRQEEQRTVTYNLNQVTAQKQTFAPQSFVQFLAGPRELDKHVYIIDLNHPFFKTININVNALDVDFEAEGITQMTVQLRYGIRPDGTGPKDTAEVILRAPSDAKDYVFYLDHKLTQSYEYKLVVNYQSKFGIGIDDLEMETPWITTEIRSLSVHPRQLGLVKALNLQLAPNIPADVVEVQLGVRYQNEDRRIDDSTMVRLNPENRAQTVYLRLAEADDQYELSRVLYYNDGAKEELATLRLPDPSQGASDDVVIVDAPRSSFFSADLLMLDPLGELQSVLVDAQVLQDGAILESIAKDLNTPGKRETLAVRLTERDKPVNLRYQERRFYRDGGLEEEGWRDAITPHVVVGIPAEGTLTVNVKYSGPQLSGLNLSGILLDLEYRDPDGNPQFDQNASLLITDDPATFNQDWKIRLPDRQARDYRWRLTLLYADGRETSTEYKQDNRNLLVLRLPQL